jgi:transposase
LGLASEALRKGVAAAAEERPRLIQGVLFDEDLRPDWQEIDTRRVGVERQREFGAWWVGLWLFEKLGLPDFLEEKMPGGREEVGWAVMTMILVLCRLCHPSSESEIAEALYSRSSLPDLLGVPEEKVNETRLYRALDRLLEHKEALEQHLKSRLGELFEIEYDLLLYDVTSTFFEGQAAANAQAQRGYSRDSRPDCKQVCIGLVVSRCGMPLGFEVFPGNRTDVTTVEEVVSTIERRYGRADRIWVMDRGMVSERNVEFLRKGDRRYILGASPSSLRHFEHQLTEGTWEHVREGLDVQICQGPGGDETFVLCRSAERRSKDAAIAARFEQRIEERLERMVRCCQERKRKPVDVAKQLGRLMERNSRAARLFTTEVRTREDGGAELVWSKPEAQREWAETSAGCYLLRTNIADWSGDELWRAYIQLTQAESAFRIQKNDLSLRPVWHQKEDRVKAHILVCFLAYVLWKTLGQICHAAGLGDEPRKVLAELAQIRQVDVVLRTESGVRIRRRCIVRPTPHQAILLQYLKLALPRQLEIDPNVV